jgi:head-tail adaptor
MAGRTPLLDVAVRQHLVSLFQPGPPVPDGEGGYTDGYQPLDPPTWWCAIQGLTAADAERVVAGTMQTTASYQVRGPFHPGITTQTRLAFRSRWFEVQSVLNEDERDIALTLTCVEVVGGGA